jgi:DNA polymerase (family 10)
MSIRVGSSFQIDLRVVPAKSWGAAMQYFTGSKEHNVRVRTLAKKQGLRINEYGVFPNDEDIDPVAGATEEDVYASIGLPWIPPEARESRTDWDEFSSAEPIELLQLQEMRGDLHMHTTATDGTATLEEMVAAAQQRGLEYIAITDHSQRVSMAGGLNEKALLEQWKRIDEFNATGDGQFHVFKGTECDILENATMDLSDNCLAQADWVLASVHYGQQQPESQITERILMAIEHPSVSAIAHPTGRLIGRRKPYEVDMTSVIAAAAANGTFLEINASPYRLDLNDTHAAQAKLAGVTIVISTDAHSPEQLNVMRFGVQQARRAGLSAANVFNTKPLAEVKNLLTKN